MKFETMITTSDDNGKVYRFQSDLGQDEFYYSTRTGFYCKQKHGGFCEVLDELVSGEWVEAD